MATRDGKISAAFVLAGLLSLAPAGASAQTEKPQYGGTLNVATVYVTLNALSWDPVDWSWKISHDAGLTYEHLFAADLSKAVRNGGRYRFVADAWLPPDAIRGELAETWRFLENPPRAQIKLRKGIMFPEKPGVMAARELTADDVVYSFHRLLKSAKRIPVYLDFIDEVEAVDKYTVLFKLNQYHSEWAFRIGYDWFSVIVPHEVTEAGAGNWKNVNGTGPFALTDYVQGNSSTFTRNPNYWDKEVVGGQAFSIPFVDKVVYRTIKEFAATLAALRTGKLDILESIRKAGADDLKKTVPQLRYSRFLSTWGSFLAMRVDTKPFDDVRVRRALNMAINKQEIVAQYYGGDAELFAYPQHPEFVGYYEPLDAMPAAVKELFTYDPDKAKKLLVDSGYPDGFTFKVQVCSCNADHMDLLPLLASYLEKVGVRIEIQPMEYGAFFSAMTTKTNAPGYLMASGHNSPIISVGKNFQTRQVWNPSQYSDPEFDKKVLALRGETDERKLQAEIKALTREILEKAPYVWLPIPYYYTAWWPWVKNYNGELRAGADRPGPIHARIWIDQEMKKKMGF